MSARVFGNVLWFRQANGFGWVIADDGRALFVHHSSIVMPGFRSLDAGERVEFSVRTGREGPWAAGVVRVEQ
jgi:CspA family cold shock protein